ncbi:MAG: hypothetical protein RL732_1225 [Bacteroidota bacterium]|jgi:hypothetical protein
MKFVHYLSKITNVNAYALTAFGLFAFLFLAAVIQVLTADGKKIKEASRLPLD